MSFRRRMVLLAAGAVAAAIVLASVVVYVVTRDELIGQADASLRQKLVPGQPQSVQVELRHTSPAELLRLQREGKLPAGALKLPPGALARIAPGGASAVAGLVEAYSGRGEAASVQKGRSVGAADASGSGGIVHSASGGTVAAPAGAATKRALPAPPGLAALARLVLPNRQLGEATGYVQLVQSDGQLLRSEGPGSALPVTPAARAVAAGRRPAFFSDETIAGTRVRVLTERAPPDGVWQVALPLTDLDTTLGHLELVLAIVSLGGIALAAALGLLVSRAALVPVRRLTGAAERVARTQDLGHRIEAGEADELGRLAASFNTMLAALERSRLAQRQLVSDASHELRTPLTSVQANLDALALGERLPAPERARIVAAAQAQLQELTVLVGDLVDLSKTEVEEVEVEAVRLDLAVAGALQRARLHAPRVPFRPRCRALPGARRARAPGSGGREPARQRPQVEPARPRRGARARRSPGGARSRPGDRRWRIYPASSIASIARPPPAGFLARDWGSRSCAKSPRPMAGPCTPPTIPAAARA